MAEQVSAIQKPKLAHSTREAASRFKGRKESRPRFIPRRRVCYFCAFKDKAIDYKDIVLLKGYLSERGKIEPRRRSGNCARHQRAIALAIKRARTLGLLPFTGEHIRKMGIAGLGVRPVVKETPREIKPPASQSA